MNFRVYIYFFIALSIFFADAKIYLSKIYFFGNSHLSSYDFVLKDCGFSLHSKVNISSKYSLYFFSNYSTSNFKNIECISIAESIFSESVYDVFFGIIEDVDIEMEFKILDNFIQYNSNYLQRTSDVSFGSRYSLLFILVLNFILFELFVRGLSSFRSRD